MEKPDRPEGPGLTEAGDFYRSAWLVYLVLAIAGILWTGFHFGDIRLDLFLDLQTWWQDLALGVGTALALVAAWALLRRWSQGARELEGVMAGLMGPLDDSQVLALALISGFTEELLFRGAMQASWGWPVTWILFTVLHTGPGAVFRYWTLFAAIAGLAFAGLTLARGNLLPAIVAHVVVNGINLRYLMALERSQERGTELE